MKSRFFAKFLNIVQNSRIFAACRKPFMIFNRIHDTFFERGYFTRSELDNLFPSTDKNNLTRWCKNGLLIKLRNNYYAFPQYIKQTHFAFYIANHIYAESYISLHSALASHNYIANYVNSQISSVSLQKTITFRNHLGNFHYQKEAPPLFFGFKPQGEAPFTFQIATPEKAILDIFYLYPNYYDTEQKIQNFAIEERMLYEHLNTKRLYEYLDIFQNQALEKRI
ncbi:MAG TPA: hypothetical protein PKK66_05100, partial [Bacteroidales bacterium]|nr:hypothetical protein [Bacteroidales bacterium]